MGAGETGYGELEMKVEKCICADTRPCPTRSHLAYLFSVKHSVGYCS